MIIEDLNKISYEDIVNYDNESDKLEEERKKDKIKIGKMLMEYQDKYEYCEDIENYARYLGELYNDLWRMVNNIWKKYKDYDKDYDNIMNDIKLLVTNKKIDDDCYNIIIKHYDQWLYRKKINFIKSAKEKLFDILDEKERCKDVKARLKAMRLHSLSALEYELILDNYDKWVEERR